jgi:hypothetical protein
MGGGVLRLPLRRRLGIQRGGQRKLSDNYRYYASKMAQLRSNHNANRPLQRQLDELLLVVKRCEAQWK